MIAAMRSKSLSTARTVSAAISAVAAISRSGTSTSTGILVAGSLAWAMAVDKFRPDRYDIAGAAICLIGVVVIMYAPRH
jgi:drug/metabolite transporter superfamily protein YnfA